MRVNTDELQRQANELQAVARRINDIQDSVLRIARNLGREQFGERFRYPLNNAAAAVGRRSDDVRKMRSALQQISRLYERTETQIVDEAEHASVHHEQSGIGSINIPDIQSIIRNPAIIVGPGGAPSWIGTRPDWIRVPPVVPIGVASILRDLIGRNRNQERNHSIAEEMLEDLENLFRDQYGPQWISEGSANRLRMRAILDEMMESVREGVTPDIDAIAEDIARTVRDGISERIPSMNDQRTAPQLPDIPEGAVDAFRDGVPSRIPSLHDQRTAPQLPDIPEGFVDAMRDAIQSDGNSGYTPPRIPDLPPVDPSDFFEGISISDGISNGAAEIADYIRGEVQINENIFRPLGPDSNPSPISGESIRDAVHAAADAISANGGLSGRPSASLDPTGPSLMQDPIFNSIDVNAGISNIAGDMPILGGEGSGLSGAIDWTPWNP